MREIGKRLGVSIDAVTYFMRKNELKRRSFSEINKIIFTRKPLSFKKKVFSKLNKELMAIGIMLYWGEGAKGGIVGRNNVVDLANSDPKMVKVFLSFLRKIYSVDEKKFRCLLYCYSNQNPKKLMKFWSDLTEIPLSQFTKPYVRKDFRLEGRKMIHGLIHIRYADKKLLIEIENMIDYYVSKYAPIA